MSDKEYNNVPDIDVLLSKPFAELDKDEQQWVLETMGSEEAFEDLRLNHAYMMEQLDDLPVIQPRKETHAALLAEFPQKERRGGFILWMNSLATFLVPPGKPVYRKPAFQMAIACLLLIGFVWIANPGATPENDLLASANDLQQELEGAPAFVDKVELDYELLADNYVTEEEELADAERPVAPVDDEQEVLPLIAFDAGPPANTFMAYEAENEPAEITAAIEEEVAPADDVANNFLPEVSPGTGLSSGDYRANLEDLEAGDRVAMEEVLDESTTATNSNSNNGDNVVMDPNTRVPATTDDKFADLADNRVGNDAYKDEPAKLGEVKNDGGVETSEVIAANEVEMDGKKRNDMLLKEKAKEQQDALAAKQELEGRESENSRLEDAIAVERERDKVNNVTNETVTGTSTGNTENNNLAFSPQFDADLDFVQNDTMPSPLVMPDSAMFLGGTFTESPSVTPLQNGVYTITATDVSTAGTADGTVTINANGSVAPYTYHWSPTPPAPTNKKGRSLAKDKDMMKFFFTAL